MKESKKRRKTNAKKTISSVKARVCGSNYEPSAGTRISIKFSADN